MKTRIAQILIVSALVTLLTGAVAQPGVASAHSVTREQAAMQPAGSADPQELEAFLDDLLGAQMADNHIPGAMVVVVEDGQVLLTKGYGYADLEHQVPVDPESTMFRVASLSKLFTWTAVMQLLEQGKLSLDTDVNEYLDFAIPAAFPEPITIRHLLSHTAGFEDKNLNMYKLDAEQVNPLSSYLKENMPTRVFPPGELIAYSNYGAALAGYIVERVSNVPFDVYVEQHIFKPLGMARSSFRQPPPENLVADVAKGYNYTGEAYIEGSFIYDQPYPAGSVSTTAADMARFMIAHLHDGELDGQRILQQETARLMHSRLFSSDPRLDGVAYGFFERTLNGQRLILHGGNLTTFHSFLYLIPDQNAGFFVSTNSTGGASAIQPIVNAMLEYRYPVAESPAPHSAAGFDQRLAPYQGAYSNARSNFTSFEKMIGLFSPINASLGNDGTLEFARASFAEVEPGLLQDVNDADNRLVYYVDPDGRLLVTGSVGIYEPVTIYRTPWYGTSGLHLLIAGTATVMFLGVLVAWPIQNVLRRRRQPAKAQPTPFPARLARWSAALFGVLLLVSLLAFAAIFADILPGFGAPRIIFDIPPVLNILLALSYVLAGLALMMPVFAVLAWLHRYWSLGGRIFYTLLALVALVMTWSLVYWDLL